MNDTANIIELKDSVALEEKVQARIRNAGVRGLSIEKAKELGVFNRISCLLCAMHTTVMAAYKIFGDVDALLDSFGGKKNEIAKACGDFERAYDKFYSFWKDYYMQGTTVADVNREHLLLYHNIMRWAQLPEAWSLGGPQRLDEDTDVVIKIDDEDEDNILRFYKTVLNEEVHESSESWCVTKYDPDTRKQICTEDDMDKASALMVAKRMSVEDVSCIYMASQVTDVTKSETVVMPYKAFKAGDTVGKISNVFKKK